MVVSKPPRSNVWKLAEAKNKLSEVVTRAVTEGPQEIHRRDDVVVVLSKEEWSNRSSKKREQSFGEFLLTIPKDVPGEPTLEELIYEMREGAYDK